MTLRLTDSTHNIWGENLPYWSVALARIASLFLMATGIFYWSDLLGVFGPSGLERGEWIVAGLRVVLACSFLISSLGVWLVAFWGVVMWALSVIAQSVAIGLFEEFIVQSGPLMLLHLLALVGLVIAFARIYLQARRNEGHKPERAI